MNTLLNPSEIALAATKPSITPLPQVAVNAAKAAKGVADVPNDLLSGLVGSAIPGLGAVDALSGLLTQDSGPTVATSNATAKFGPDYVQETIAKSKTGSFVVTSGKSQTNQDLRSGDNPGSSMSLSSILSSPIILLVAVVAAVVLIWRR